MAKNPNDLLVAENCFQVGRRNPESLLQCNTYLRSFELGGNTRFHWCVDPGSQIDYPQVRENLLLKLESLSQLNLFSINHQDPDVVGNLVYMTEENPELTGLVTEDVWRLVRHLKAFPKDLRFTNKFKHNVARLPAGHRIQLVPTPFCHFRGAMAFYDPEAQVLFSGDLFGGLNQPGRVQIWGEEPDWTGIALFHQIYMPSREAVRFAIRQVRALSPAVKIIAPQHGFVLQGDFMQAVLDRLYELPVGMDRLASELDEKYLPGYREVFHETLHEAALQLGRAEVHARLKGLPSDHELAECIKIQGQNIELVGKGIQAVALLVDVLAADQFENFRNVLRSHVLQGCALRDLPIPQLGIGVEERGEGVLA